MPAEPPWCRHFDYEDDADGIEVATDRGVRGYEFVIRSIATVQPPPYSDACGISIERPVYWLFQLSMKSHCSVASPDSSGWTVVRWATTTMCMTSASS